MAKFQVYQLQLLLEFPASLIVSFVTCFLMMWQIFRIISNYPLFNLIMVCVLVLPEMPLPSPLPQTLSNKSLLFHPRVAEEAQILLSHPNELLIPQLVYSLAQTTSEHM